MAKIARNRKTGGRKKGTPNKVTKDVREAYTLLVHQNIPKLQGWLDRVGEGNPEKALQIMISLSEYVIPKHTRVNITSDNEAPAFNVPLIHWVKTDESK